MSLNRKLPSALFTGSQQKNALINGDFTFWQRNITFPSIASASYSSDRWKFYNSSAAVFDISRSTDVPTVAQSGHASNFSTLIDCTTADASVDAGDRIIFYQPIEGYNFVPLAQKKTTVSFWIKAFKTGIYCAWQENYAADRAEVKEFTINTTNTWEKKVLTFDASPAGGTWNYTDSVGLYLGITLMAGSTYQTTPDAWQTGEFHATASQVNGADSTSNNLWITQVQIESGTTASPFEYRNYTSELDMCQRYYQKSYDIDVAPGTAAATNYVWVGAQTNASPSVHYNSILWNMRIAPTMAVYRQDGTLGSITFVAPSGAQTNRTPNIVPQQRSFYIYQSTAVELMAYGHWTADAEL